MWLRSTILISQNITSVDMSMLVSSGIRVHVGTSYDVTTNYISMFWVHFYYDRHFIFRF
jgi:hypothetical protein